MQAVLPTPSPDSLSSTASGAPRETPEDTVAVDPAPRASVYPPPRDEAPHDAATQLGYQSHFYARELAIEDDHLPFKNVGVPVADLIDYDYGYNNAFHHTSEDTLDKLSPKSLQIVGDVVLNTLQRLDAQ